jgi:hypothetical protein
MALKIFDGFDHYATQADLQARVGGLQWSDVTPGTVTFVTGRGGYGYAIALQASVSGGSQMGGSLNANYASGFLGIALQIQPVALAYVDFQVMDYVGGAAQLTFRCNVDSGTIVAYRGDPISGGTVLATSPPNAFSPYVWAKYEASAVISSSGSFDFHIQGNSIFGGISGVNTQNTSNSFFNGLRVRTSGIGAGLVANAVYIDDFNFNDSTTGPGTYPLNGFIGDCATRTLFTAANSSVQWTTLANTNHVEVGEYQFDRDTSYNYATTVGDTDLFTFGSLPTTTSAVFGVQLTGGYRKQDASAQTIVNVFSSSGTVLNGNAWALSLDWAFYTDLSVLDPHTSATWTPAAVNALIGGYKLNS